MHDHAIVLGASIAGLLTARVLADHYAEVTIVERDTSVFGYTLQSAVADVAVLNPWIYSGTE